MNLARRTRITRGSKQRAEFWDRAGYARTMVQRRESSDGMPSGGWAIFLLEYGRRKPAYYYIDPSLAEHGPFSSRESAVKDARKEEERWSAARHREVLRGMGIVGGKRRRVYDPAARRSRRDVTPWYIDARGKMHPVSHFPGPIPEHLLPPTKSLAELQADRDRVTKGGGKRRRVTPSLVAQAKALRSALRK